MKWFPMSLAPRLRRFTGFMRWLRPRALGTIRGRLAFGFGATVLLVAIIALVAVTALRASNDGNTEAMTSVEQEFEGSH